MKWSEAKDLEVGVDVSNIPHGDALVSGRVVAKDEEAKTLTIGVRGEAEPVVVECE